MRSTLQTVDLPSTTNPPAAVTRSVADQTVRIDQFLGGVLSGSVAVAGVPLPERLLVSADGRTLGETVVSSRFSAVPTADPESRSGTWSFDARDLPPNLLLQDNITFAVGLCAHPMVPLDRIEIAASAFPSISTLSPGDGALDGFIDGTENGLVRGWIWDPAHPGTRVKVRLFVDERFCGTYRADQPRPDLAASGRGDGRYGFSIPAQAFFERAGGPAPDVRVISTEPQLWAVPLAPHLRAKRRRFVMPRPRDIPTTRELTTILSSAEPFPKKVYVIDRLTRTMPDAFSADYILLALEFLRIEMLEAQACPPTTWREHVAAWWHQRAIRRQVERLSALATASAASQTLLGATARRPAVPPVGETSR